MHHYSDTLLEIETLPASVTDCTCSICRRLGVRWAYYHPDEVEVVCVPGATIVYRWNDRCIEFHHCRVCGCTTHYDGVDGEPLRAVNAGLLDAAELEGIPVRLFDGAKL
jgi:hypothetical protein